jgi:hypothetical protein
MYLLMSESNLYLFKARIYATNIVAMPVKYQIL